MDVLGNASYKLYCARPAASAPRLHGGHSDHTSMHGLTEKRSAVCASAHAALLFSAARAHPATAQENARPPCRCGMSARYAGKKWVRSGIFGRVFAEVIGVIVAKQRVRSHTQRCAFQSSHASRCGSSWSPDGQNGRQRQQGGRSGAPRHTGEKLACKMPSLRTYIYIS